MDEIRVYGDELIGPSLRCIEISKFQKRSQTWHQVEEQYIPRTKDFGLSLVDFVRFVVSGWGTNLWRRTNRTKRLRCIEIPKKIANMAARNNIYRGRKGRKDFGLSLVNFVGFVVSGWDTCGDEPIGPSLRCIEIPKKIANVQLEEQYIPRRKDFRVSLVDFVGFVVSGWGTCGDEPIGPSDSFFNGFSRSEISLDLRPWSNVRLG